MLQVFSSSFALSFFSFFIFFLVSASERISAANALSIDIINQTCQKCADQSKVFSYSFCSSSLQAIPVSHVTNLEGLALIGVELALVNATSTVSTIKNLLSGGTFDPFPLACLEICLELYSDAVTTLVDGAAAFLMGQYDVAGAKVTSVMEASETCEAGFFERKGEVSPLSEENSNLSQLSAVALCIIRLLSLAVTFQYHCNLPFS